MMSSLTCQTNVQSHVFSPLEMLLHSQLNVYMCNIISRNDISLGRKYEVNSRTRDSRVELS